MYCCLPQTIFFFQPVSPPEKAASGLTSLPSRYETSGVGGWRFCSMWFAVLQWETTCSKGQGKCVREAGGWCTVLGVALPVEGSGTRRPSTSTCGEVKEYLFFSLSKFFSCTRLLSHVVCWPKSSSCFAPVHGASAWLFETEDNIHACAVSCFPAGACGEKRCLLDGIPQNSGHF